MKIIRKLKLIIVNKLANSPILSSKARVTIYRLCGIDIEKGVFMHPKSILNGTGIRIGENTFVNYHCTFENQAHIEIGQDCSIGMEVMFCTATHEVGPAKKRAGKVIGLPIKIEDGCWIGSRATILAGVTIEHGCIIGAGALVTKRCEANGIYAGIPARRVKELESTTFNGEI